MMLHSTVFHRGEHVDHQNLLPFAAGCPFCGSERRKTLLNLQMDPQIELMRCESCFCCSASRIPTDACLSKYYAKYYEDLATSQDGRRVTNHDLTGLATHIFEMFFSAQRAGRFTMQRPLSILDFGGGDGSLALEVAHRVLALVGGYAAVTVIDFNSVVREIADPRISTCRYPDLGSLPAGGKFDLVIASSVLEHLPFPRPTLELLLSIVSPDGHFYARTPYVQPVLSAAAALGKSIDFTFPGHIHDMGQAFWEQFLSGQKEFNLVVSRPSLVETKLSLNPIRTIAAHALKAPWHLLAGVGRRWPFVGGWEVGVQRVRAT